MLPGIEYIKTALNAIMCRFHKVQSNVDKVQSNVDKVQSNVDKVQSNVDTIKSEIGDTSQLRTNKGNIVRALNMTPSNILEPGTVVYRTSGEVVSYTYWGGAIDNQELLCIPIISDKYSGNLYIDGVKIEVTSASFDGEYLRLNIENGGFSIKIEDDFTLWRNSVSFQVGSYVELEIFASERITTKYLTKDSITSSVGDSTDCAPSEKAVKQYSDSTYEKLFEIVELTPSNGSVSITVATNKFYNCGEVTKVSVGNLQSVVSGSNLDCYIRFDCGETPASVDFSYNVDIIKSFSTISSNRSYLIHLIKNNCYITEMQSSYDTSAVNTTYTTVSTYKYTNATADPYNNVINNINNLTNNGSNVIVDWGIVQNLLVEKKALYEQLVVREPIGDIELPLPTVEAYTAKEGDIYRGFLFSSSSSVRISKKTASGGEHLIKISWVWPGNVPDDNKYKLSKALSCVGVNTNTSSRNMGSLSFNNIQEGNSMIFYVAYLSSYDSSIRDDYNMYFRTGYAYYTLDGILKYVYSPNTIEASYNSLIKS